MMLFGFTFDEWMRVISWAGRRYGHPRYMAPIRAILWCKMKWEQAERPQLPDRYTPEAVRLFHDALLTAAI